MSYTIWKILIAVSPRLLRQRIFPLKDAFKPLSPSVSEEPQQRETVSIIGISKL